MHINTQSGDWYCDNCERSGGLVDLYAMATGKSYDTSLKETLFLTSYSNTEFYWDADIFGTIVKKTKGFIKPHCSLRKIGEWHRDLNNDERFREEIKLLYEFSEKEVAQNNLGRIIYNRRKILVWPDFDLGELDSINFIEPYTGRLLGNNEQTSDA